MPGVRIVGVCMKTNNSNTTWNYKKEKSKKHHVLKFVLTMEPSSYLKIC